MAHFLKPKTVYKELYSYQEEAVDGDLNHLQYGAPVPRALSRFNPRLIMGGGAVVSPENMPTKVVLHGPKRELPDLINRFGMLFVSRRTLDIFKTFQKSIQCFPVTVLWTDGTEAGQFFFLFTTVLLDAVDRDRTTKRWRPAPSQAAASTGVWVDEPGTTFVFRQSLMGNVHFWLDAHMSGPLLSDNLYNALRRENIEAFHETEHFLEV